MREAEKESAELLWFTIYRCYRDATYVRCWDDDDDYDKADDTVYTYTKHPHRSWAYFKQGGLNLLTLSIVPHSDAAAACPPGVKVGEAEVSWFVFLTSTPAPPRGQELSPIYLLSHCQPWQSGEAPSTKRRALLCRGVILGITPWLERQTPVILW